MTHQDIGQERLRTNSRLWHKSAPDAVVRAHRKGDEEACWAGWQKHLAKRKEPVSPDSLWVSNGNMVLWAANAAGVDGDTRRLVLSMQWLLAGDESWAETSKAWIEKAASGPIDAGQALEAVGWARALPSAAATMEADAWWDLLECLLGLAQEAAELPLERQPLVQQLVGGELALTLGYLFSEIAVCRKAAKSARKVLTAGMLELLDGEGLPHGDVLEVFHPLLACWTRCRLLGDQMEKDCCSAKAGRQYEWAVRAILRLTRADGSQVFSNGEGSADDSGWISAALECGGDEEDEAMASLWLPDRSPAKDVDAGLLPSPADHSSWASVTILQPGWGRQEPKLAMSYGGADFRMELSQQRELLLSGTWTPEVKVGGELLAVESTWQELCWVSDDDVDYLELELSLSRGARIQRHVVMAREDRFLLLADTVMGCPEGTIDYCGRLSLADGAGLAPAEESHEAFLMGDKAAALVLPLAFPEWRVEKAPGRFESNSGAIELGLSGEGGALFAPLFFDLKPRRMTRPMTWRRLTVAQNLEILPPSVAVGYRVMVGKAQWLIYRSLGPAANRTLLGHNLATEMLVARFDRKGEVEPLIEIED